MAKPLRLLLALFAVFSLTALAACGDDDDDASDTTSEDTRDAEEGGEDEGEGGEESSIVCPEGTTEIFPPSGEPADGATPVTITATEYNFAGTEALSATGSYAVSLENAGNEAHEMIVQKIGDDETRSVEELLTAAQGGEDMEAIMTDVGAASACPGVTTPVGIEIESPGRYIVVCNFPVGATAGADFAALPEGGPNHLQQGMLQEITIS